MSILRLTLQTPIADHHATDTSDETRKLEIKLDALVNLVAQLAANQKPACGSRVCGIRSSNNHRTGFSARNDIIIIRGVHDVATDTSAETRNLEDKLNALVNLQTQFSAINDAIVIRGVHGVATDASAETRKLLGKLDALVNLVTQLAVSQKPASVTRVCGIRPSNDHHTSVCLLRSNLEWMCILRPMLQTPIADHHDNIDKALDREDGSQLLVV
ncbi:hypothetical protein Fmac_032864 [Flemingia macrophylla]|uniref:Uncharacterized protein n=1 Tax=Flemingia macrophylla TaxID=520843 RepID=A0ABD1L650_9FABA